MDRWLSENQILVGWAAGLALTIVVAGVLQWFFRRDRRRIYTVGEYLTAFALLTPFYIARIVLLPVWSPGLDAFVTMAQLGAVFVVATVITHVRSTRAERRDANAGRAAKAAIPRAAHEYFGTESFLRDLAGITEAHPPTPETASDVIAYWVFRALDSGDHAAWSRLVFYATAIKGWRVSSPTLASEVPWLVTPYQASGDKRWDPAVDQSFRDHALALLTARFGTAVPA